MIAPTVLGALASGCVSFSDGPARLYTVPEETQLIRDQVQQINLVQYSSLDEASRKRIRNDYIAARMYAIDIQYTPYEAALTKERQGVGFGAAATTVALTTASGLVSPVATKNVLTGLAGFVTGARAAYDSDVLLSHSVQWIQSQMEANRAYVSNRILNGMKQSTTDYPLAAALSDLEAYYRAGTFTGGLLSTSEVIAADAQNAADSKARDQGQLDPAAPPPPRPKPPIDKGAPKPGPVVVNPPSRPTDPGPAADALPCGVKPLDEAAGTLLTFLCPTNKGINKANRTELEKLRPELKGNIFTVLTEDTPAQKVARADLKKRFDDAGLGKK